MTAGVGGGRSRSKRDRCARDGLVRIGVRDGAANGPGAQDEREVLVNGPAGSDGRGLALASVTASAGGHRVGSLRHSGEAVLAAAIGRRAAAAI